MLILAIFAWVLTVINTVYSYLHWFKRMLLNWLTCADRQSTVCNIGIIALSFITFICPRLQCIRLNINWMFKKNSFLIMKRYKWHMYHINMRNTLSNSLEAKLYNVCKVCLCFQKLFYQHFKLDEHISIILRSTNNII